MAPTPYTIAVEQSRLDRLKQKLELAEFPDELDGADWDYGAPLQDVKRLAQYWKTSFDWRKTEAKLNELPNSKTAVNVDEYGDVDVHFVHQTSSQKNAVPLLFVHGWPGSYIEVTKMLPLLAQSTNGVNFHVVAPSLPNYAWSSGIKKKGFGLAQYAETCHKLMQQLGYDKYVTQGGDWGFYITRTIGHLYPTSCLASHINMIRASPPSWTSQPLLALSHATTSYTASEQAGLERSNWFANEGSGYRTIQSTKPQTPGYGVTDSPVGLLAWIYEKLHDWTDGYPWTDNEICTWVSIYWFSTAGPAASFRIYYEATHDSVGREEKGGTYVSRDRTQQWIGGVKLGLAFAPRELTVLPRSWGYTLGDVVYASEKKHGGHFLAWERPQDVADDLRAMFGSGGLCDGIVK